MGGTFRAPKVQQRVIPVVDTEAEAKKRAEKQKQIGRASCRERVYVLV